MTPGEPAGPSGRLLRGVDHACICYRGNRFHRFRRCQRADRSGPCCHGTRAIRGKGPGAAGQGYRAASRRYRRSGKPPQRGGGGGRGDPPRLHARLVAGSVRKNGCSVLLGGLPTGIVSRFLAVSAEADRRAIDTLGVALKGSGRPLVTTFGAMGLADSTMRAPRPATENDAPAAGSPGIARAMTEEAVEALASLGVRATMIRLAPSVHGDGDTGFVPQLIATARKKRNSAYIGDGANRWTAVHRADAARLFRLALESGVAGARYHGVAEASIPFRTIADVIGRQTQCSRGRDCGKSSAETVQFSGALRHGRQSGIKRPDARTARLAAHGAGTDRRSRSRALLQHGAGGVMRADLVWGWATFGFTLLVPATLWVGHYDRRLLAGVNVWSKPFKFALSLAIHFATFAVIAVYLSDGERQRPWIVLAATVSTAAGACELAYIALQAARGRHSHFNKSTPVEAVAAALMGIGALIVVSPGVLVGFALTVSPPSAWPAAVTLGTVSGLIGGAVLTVLTASQMGAVRSHFANGKPGSGRTMPITGWSLNGADLRPSHFLATHMMQAVPIASVIAAETLPASAALGVSALAAIVWTAMTLALFRWTMKGLSPAAILRASSTR